MEKNITFKIVDIEKHQDPTDFFNYCLENKLFKAQQEEKNFISHMKVIFENEKERFAGCLAVIAYENKKPIGMVYLQKVKDFMPMRVNECRSYISNNLMNTTKSRFLKEDKNTSAYPVHLGGLLHLDNRERKDIWRQKCDFQFLHTGFMMMYIKPKHRGKKIISKMIELSELKIADNLKNSFDELPEIVKNYPKRTFLTITAKSKALEILRNKEEAQTFNINAIDLSPDTNNFRIKISNLSYSIFYEHSLKNTNLENIFKNLENKKDILDSVELLTINDFKSINELNDIKIKVNKRKISA